MSNTDADVLRLHSSETGLQPIQRTKADGYATDTYKIIHKFPDGSTKKWTPDEELDLDASDLSYTNTSYATLTDVELALNYLLRESITIHGLTNDVGIFERGLIKTDVTPSWAGISGTVTALNISDTYWGVDAAIAIDSTSYPYSGIGLTGSSTWTLAASDGVTETTDTTVIAAGLYSYWGQSASATPNETIIEAALNGGSSLEQDQASARSKAEYSQAGGGNYIYYAYPSAWGSVSIKVNGFGSTWNETTVSVTNASGYTCNYKCYTSPNTIVGTVTLEFTAA
jgi:hypothetical protein